MSKTSVLVPLGQKSRAGTSSAGLLNPAVSTSLSSTPSPVVTPLNMQSIEYLKNMQMPSLSPAPSPIKVSSALVSPPGLPLIDVQGLESPPSPEIAKAQSKIHSSLASLQSMPPSPRISSVISNGPPSPEMAKAQSKIHSSLASLQSMPPSPRTSSVSALSATPSVISNGPPSPEMAKAQSKIHSSLASLQSMPPSPRIDSGMSSMSGTSMLNMSNAKSDPVSELELSLRSESSSPEVSLASLVMHPQIDSGMSSMSGTSMLNMSNAKSDPVSELELSLRSESSLHPPIGSDRASMSDMSKSAISTSPEALKAQSNINSSLASLRSMDSSIKSFPSSPSLERLPGFAGVSSGAPIALPSIPSTGELKPLVTKHTTVSDLSDSTASFHDYQGMIHDKNVEQTLTESGYLPIDKILTKDENDMMMCQYIKAIDSTGRTTFVDMDCEGLVSVDPDTMAAKISNASIVPYSVKMGAYECANSDVCGVAFECDNEICTLKRSSDDLSPKETVFTQVKHSNVKSHGHHGMTYGHPIAYPIVSLSDIKTNPEQVACSIKDSHNRMRNIAFGQCDKDTKNLMNSTQSLNNEIKRYDNNQKVISCKLSSTLLEFENLRERFKHRPPTTDKGRKLLRSVHFNLRKRNDLVIDYLKLCESVNSRVDRIRELAGEIKDLNDYSEQLFQGLDNVYQE